MAWSEKAIEAVLFEFDLDIEDEANKANARRALYAAAAVDGDAGWNAAIDRAAHTIVQFGVKDYTAEEVAARIRSLKRLK